MKEYNLTSNWRNFVMSKWDSKGTGIIHLKGINKYNLISNDSWCTFTPAVFVKLAFETFKLDVYRKTKQKNKTKQKQTNQKTKQTHIVNIQGKNHTLALLVLFSNAVWWSTIISRELLPLPGSIFPLMVPTVSQTYFSTRERLTFKVTVLFWRN